ncbi:error-prone DNA polymerase [Pseudahrensia aquimaris]|uniref:Error-prone DNA polymerase n=1 Tax=Pseudahrensia aquimaris TaxID=744461 RepID=A0ABW3F8P9_9HYPH
MSRPPENPPIPFKRPKASGAEQAASPDGGQAYAELQCLTNFSFLRGASHPGEMVIQAKSLGHTAIGIADSNTLAGVVRAHAEAKREGVQLLVGARIELTDGFSCLCYPSDRKAYGRLCKLLSDGKRSAAKGECDIALSDLVARCEGQVLIVLPPADFDARRNDLTTMISQLKQASQNGVWLALNHLYRGDDRKRMRSIAALASEQSIPLVATNDALYHHPDRRKLQDVVTCIREGCQIGEAGFLLEANAERHLKPAQEMARLFKDYPQAITATQEIVALCDFNLDELQYNYPNEPVPAGKTAQKHLEDLIADSLQERFKGNVPPKVQALLDKELTLIADLKYAHYFLTVHDIVKWARDKNILCQGRGSAANSAVCYYLNVTAVDPEQSSLLFERFLSKERKEPPDIDVDFEHERREEVIQYIYERYGRHRAAIAATVITYRPRSAVREVGKVMGLSEDVTAALASTVWGSWGKEIPEDQIREAGLDLSDPLLKMTVDLTQELLGFPRHLSQHVGGFVLTEDPLEELVPIGNAAMDDRTFIEWDKDDIDELGILKVDVLALGMLTCIAKCFDLVKQHYGLSYNLATIDQENDQVYEMIQRADTLGVFQIESRAQMNMLPRLKPKTFYDLVIEVAIVRPGPIQGDMVHPYLKRRDGIEKVVYPWPTKFPEKRDELEKILGRTLGVPLFQEQAMQIAIDAAEFSPEEANKLRRAMATFRNVGTIHLLQQRMVTKMIERGYDAEFAANCFEQIKGFGSYGFPESHAASFAQLVYVSCWLKCFFPDVFCAALLNSQPMGFYAPAQIVRDAREHGVEVRPVDLNHSHWDNALEAEKEDGHFAIRLGFRQVTGLKQADMEAFIARRTRHIGSPDEARRLTGLSIANLERLASADAFRSMGMDRRQALWAVRGMGGDEQLPLFEAADASALGHDPEVALPEMPLREHVVADYQTHRLSLKAHPMALLRPLYDKGIKSQDPKQAWRKPLRTLQTKDLLKTRQNEWVTIAGVVLVRQKPGTAKGVVFITLEDETGTANIVVWSKLLAKYRRTVMSARLMAVRGKVQREGEVIHVVAQELIDRTADLDALSDDEFELQFANADHVKSPLPEVSSMKRKIERLAARGETAEGDLGIETDRARRNPGVSNANIIPLSRADEVLHPQVERDGWPIDSPDAKRYTSRQSSIEKAKPIVVNQGRHPRNVRIIPKSRDFH